MHLPRSAESNSSIEGWLFRSFVFALALGLLSAEAGLSADTVSRAEAQEKIRATMMAALAESPQAARRLSRLGAEAAILRAESGPGSPVLSWQSEGIGGGFDRTANGVDKLQLSVPFNRPWRMGVARDLRSASASWLETGEQATAAEVAALAGRGWLDLAAATERVRLAELRLARLERALIIQEKRYELGEISGSERRQVELQHAREAALLQELERQRVAVQRELETLIPGGFPQPTAADLTGLVDSTTSPTASADAGRPTSGPLSRFSQATAELARLESEFSRGAAWGAPEVEVEWERIPDFGVVEGFDAFGFRLAFPLPIGRQGKQRVLAAELAAEAAEAERNQVRERLSARYRSALASAKSAQDALEALAPSLAEIETTEHSLSEQFRLGAISYLVYLDGFARVDEVLQRAVEARLALLTARLEVAEILGTDTYFPFPELESEDSA